MSEETKSSTQQLNLKTLSAFDLWKQYYFESNFDHKDIVEELENRCSLGDGDAYAGLGNLYMTREHDSKYYNKEEGIKLLLKGCELKSGYAFISMGDNYWCGSDKTIEKTMLAIKYYEQACELGSLSAFSSLAEVYLKSKFVIVDRPFVKIREICEKGCQLNDKISFCALGALYLKGHDGIPQDEFKGIELLVKAKELGDEQAVRILNDNKLLYITYQQKIRIDSLEKTIEDMKNLMLANYSIGKENVVMANTAQYI
jgi:TPR repeat protein